MKKTLAILTALTLSAALLAGCSAGGSAKTSAAPSTTPSAAVTTAPETQTPSPAATATPAASYSKDDLKAALDGCVSYEADSAGGSLKAASAAAALVTFSAQNASQDNLDAISADLNDWYSGLTDTEKTQLKANWSDLYTDAQNLVADPAGQADLLSDAGVTTDFSKMDLTNGISLCNMIDSLMQG